MRGRAQHPALPKQQELHWRVRMLYTGPTDSVPGPSYSCRAPGRLSASFTFRCPWAPLLATSGCHGRKLHIPQFTEVCFPLQLQMAYLGTAEAPGCGRLQFFDERAHIWIPEHLERPCAAWGRPALMSQSRGPGVPGGSRAQPVSSDKLFMNELFVVQGVHQLL